MADLSLSRCTWTRLLMISGAFLALNQTSFVTAQEPQAEAIEEVLVVAKPIKASQLSSIEAKRNSANLVDVVSADAIGRFPDTNLADSLGRLPGVSVEEIREERAI